MPVICHAGKLEEVYSLLVDANPNMAVYKKEEIPERFHYQHNVRIMPILIEAKEGWTIMQNRTGSFMCTFLRPQHHNGAEIIFWSACCSHYMGFVSLLKQRRLSALIIASKEIYFSR